MAFPDIRPSAVIQTRALNSQPIHVSIETLSPWINLGLSKFADTIAQVQGLTLGSDRYPKSMQQYL
jgi:hypothetical protein